MRGSCTGEVEPLDALRKLQISTLTFHVCEADCPTTMTSTSARFRTCATAWIFCCFFSLLPAGAQQSPAKTTDDRAIEMQRLDVVAVKYQWLYAKTRHFEVLSEIQDKALIARTVQILEQMTNLFAKHSSVYRWDGDLPTKLIFISEQGIDRFLRAIGINDPYFHSKLPAKALSSNYTPRTYIRDYTKADGEQMIILITVPDSDLKRDIPHENLARDYAVNVFKYNYMPHCLSVKKIFSSSVSLSDIFNNLRRAPLHDDIDILSDKKNLSSGVFTITGTTIEIRKYNVLGDCNLITQAPEYALPLQDVALEARYSIWKEMLQEIKAKYFQAPYLDLGFVLENRLALVSTRNSFPIVIEKYYTHKREIIDFAYYCLFGPNQKAREGYDKLLLFCAKHSSPAKGAPSKDKTSITEDIFKEYFGASYQEFFDEMYA